MGVVGGRAVQRWMRWVVLLAVSSFERRDQVGPATVVKRVAVKDVAP